MWLLGALLLAGVAGLGGWLLGERTRERNLLEDAFRLRPEQTSPPTTTERVTTASPLPSAKGGGELCLILDDVGASREQLEPLLALPREVAMAVLPFLPYSQPASRTLSGAGHDVLLHLPMEPHGYPATDPGPGALLLSMQREELEATLVEALDNVPEALAVNNHMGSAFTESRAGLAVLMPILKSYRLGFVDSRTSQHSVAEAVAREAGLAVTSRQVFLDNEDNATQIRAMLGKAADLAREQGRALAIGHARPTTVAVLIEQLPALAERGVRLVHLREYLGLAERPE